jgi:hypothetical protein
MKKVALAAVSLSLLSPIAVLSDPPFFPNPHTLSTGRMVNQWFITAFDDTTPSHTELATQIICFNPPSNFGTNTMGTWYSISFPDWNGLWFQEGDLVIMTGDYTRDTGHDEIHFDLAAAERPTVSTGQWTEWREDGAFGVLIGKANARLERRGRCRVEDRPPQAGIQEDFGNPMHDEPGPRRAKQ